MHLSNAIPGHVRLQVAFGNAVMTDTKQKSGKSVKSLLLTRSDGCKMIADVRRNIAIDKSSFNSQLPKSCMLQEVQNAYKV